MQLEGKNVALQILNQQLELLNNLALTQASRPTNLYISNQVSQSNSTFIDANPELAKGLNQALDILSEIRSLSRDSFVENEVEKLSSQVQEAKQAKSEGDYKNKGVVGSLLRFLEKAGDATTNLGRTLTGIEEISVKLSALKDIVISLLS
jgi:hypothetical protein